MLEKRIMGLDYGSKTIGVAVSDLLGFTAQGIETININEQVKDFKIKRIKELVLEHNVGTIVVGLPKNMNNSVGFRGEATLYFVEVLKKKMLRDLLDLTYNVDTCFGYLKTLIETVYDKGVDNFVKESDEKTIFLTNMFSFISFERPFHFDNLLELFSFEFPEVSKEKVDFFKENIIKNIGYKEIEKLNEIQRYKLAKTGRNEYQIFGENVVLTIDMVRDYLAV